MKKVIVFSLVLGAICLLAGCQKENEWKESSETATKTDLANIEEVLITKDNICIKYPKLINLVNSKIEDKWNGIIQEKITSDLDLLTENDVYNLDYEVVSSSEDELSIKMVGSCHYDGATQPFSFIYTYNISLETGDSIRLCDRADVNQLAEKIYNNQGFQIETTIKEKFIDYIYSAFDNEELLAEMLMNFDYSEDNNQPFGYSFYQDGRLHLCIELPHDLGDFIIIELENS